MALGGGQAISASPFVDDDVICNRAGRVDDGALPRNLVILPSAVEHGVMPLLPEASPLPVAQTAPAAHARAAGSSWSRYSRRQ
jgi:hypothetical protein